jgi:hypothetical protein
MLPMLAFFVLLAILTPLFGADTRDGLDWACDHLGLRRHESRELKTSDSPAPACAGRAAAAGCRTAPAGG